mgnify:CR=1 FL=1
MKTISFGKYTFDVSVSTFPIEDKNTCNFSKIKYKRQTLTFTDFINRIEDGYSFCYCFNDNGRVFGQSEKRIDNFHHTNFIVFDVDHCGANIHEYLNRLPYKPTLAYTTTNDSKLDHRFRLIYFLDFTIMKSDSFYKMVYYKLASHLEIYSGFKMEDNCMKSSSQQFLGNPKKEITTVYNNILYELDDINKLSFNKRYENEYNWIKDNANVSNIDDIDLKISDEMKDDLNNMKDSDFIKKWREKYFYQMETPVTYDDDGIARLWDKEYYKIMNKFSKADGHSLKFKHGEKRRVLLFNMISKMLKINPKISDENLLFNTIVERYYFFDNVDGKLNNAWILSAIKNARMNDMNGRNPSVPENITFKIQKSHFIDLINKWNDEGKNGMMVLTNKIRKKINIERVGALYDFNLSVKENLKWLASQGLSISQAKLYRLKKSNFEKVEIA